jgi:hypothetical protein
MMDKRWLFSRSGPWGLSVTISITEHTNTNKNFQTCCANGNANDCSILDTKVSARYNISLPTSRIGVWSAGPSRDHWSCWDPLTILLLY